MAQRIGDVVSGVLQQTRQQHGALFAIQRAWTRVVGRPLAAHTRPVSLRNSRLVVQADRPGEAFALNYQRQELLRRLERVAQRPIEEVVIRAGDPQANRRGARVRRPQA